MKHKREKGGSVEQTGPHEEETNEERGEKMKIADGHEGKERGNEKEEVAKKKGGAVHRRKRGGSVHGAKPHERLDKRARGGGVAKNPMSSASAENLPYAHGNLRAGSEGTGKDPT